MVEIIDEAISFAKFLRFQFCQKQKQVFKRNIYEEKIWGSQVRGGLEVCDYIIFKNRENPFKLFTEIEEIYLKMMESFKVTNEHIDTPDTYEEYANKLTRLRFKNKDKNKIEAMIFEKDIKFAVIRGAFYHSKYLFDKIKSEPCEEVGPLIGDIHILRMTLWNKYVDKNNKRRNLRKVTINDVMEKNPKVSHVSLV